MLKPSPHFALTAQLALAGSLLVALLAWANPESMAADPTVNTFSIVAFDPATGDLGVAVASKVLGVGSIVPFAKAGVGAIATQAAANTAYGPEGLALLESRQGAEAVVQQLTGGDDGRKHRQLGVVDAQGVAASFTGEECIAWAGNLVGEHFTVQGNLLTGEDVIQDMAAAYREASQKKESELADWLLAALSAGEAAGGDNRGKQSAAILIVRARAGYGGNDRYIDLRVEDHADPVVELGRLLELHKEAFSWPHEHKPTAESAAGRYPQQREGDFVIRDFAFNSGETLPELKMHYLTVGRPRRDDQGVVRNAVLILHGTTGSSQQFLRPEFAEELYGPGQALDANKYFLIIPDNIGHGQSFKPSDKLRAAFPKYGYLDMIEAQRRLLVEGLDVDHLRLVIGTSMGGMHTWLWGQRHPVFMDALMPLASLPTQINGRNRVWRRLVIDAISKSPDYDNGNYDKQPAGLATAMQMMYFMSSNPVLRVAELPSLADVDAALDKHVAAEVARVDANDVLYAFAASHDYDPGPGLEQIKAPLVAINSADDLINPPELRVLEREIVRVPHGTAIVLPLSDETRGHGSHTTAKLWKHHLVELLERTE
jgi:homoserine O-acetyltransferase